MKITTVCFGNINRSAAAKYVIEHIAAERGLECEVDSTGTSDCNAAGTIKKNKPPRKVGAPMRKTMRDKLNEYYPDMDFSDHRAKQITEEIVKESDIIVYMDKKNERHLRSMFGNLVDGKLFPLSKFQTYSEIDDPHFAKKEEVDEKFTEVAEQIIESSSDMVDRLLNGETIADQPPSFLTWDDE